jgi:hypothetical protein
MRRVPELVISQDRRPVAIVQAVQPLRSVQIVSGRKQLWGQFGFTEDQQGTGKMPTDIVFKSKIQNENPNYY